MKNDNSIQRPIEHIINDLEEASITSRNLRKEDVEKVESILFRAVVDIMAVRRKIDDYKKLFKKPYIQKKMMRKPFEKEQSLVFVVVLNDEFLNNPYFDTKEEADAYIAMIQEEGE